MARKKTAPASRPTWVRLAEDVKAAAHKLAKADDRSLSVWIARLVADAVREAQA